MEDHDLVVFPLVDSLMTAYTLYQCPSVSGHATVPSHSLFKQYNYALQRSMMPAPVICWSCFPHVATKRNEEERLAMTLCGTCVSAVCSSQ